MRFLISIFQGRLPAGLLVLWAALWLLPTGCVMQLEKGTEGPGSSSEVQLELRIPDTGGARRAASGSRTAGALGPAGTLGAAGTVGPAGASRSATPDQESAIDLSKLHLILFHRVPGGTKFEYVANYQASSISPPRIKDGMTSYTLSLRIPIPDRSDTYKLMVLANLSNESWGTILQSGGGPEYNFHKLSNDNENPMEQIRIWWGFNVTLGTTFSVSRNWPVAPNYLMPMWGESGVFSFPSGPALSVGSIPLIRSVARIDVGVNLKQNGDHTWPLDAMVSQGLPGDLFKLTSVRMCGIGGSAFGPQENALSPDRRSVTKTSLAPVTLSYVDYGLSALQNDGSGNRTLTRTCYMPEGPNHGVSDNNTAVGLVVGGSYKGGADSYYRIDFYDRIPGAGGSIPKPTADTRIDILRNHLYVVNITGVHGNGYSTPEEAWAADPILMDAEVVAWEQNEVDAGSEGIYNLTLNAPRFHFNFIKPDGTLSSSKEMLQISTNYNGLQGSGWTITPDVDAQQRLYFVRNDGTKIRFGDADWPSSGAAGTAMLPMGMELPTGEAVTYGDSCFLDVRAGKISRRLTLVRDPYLYARITVKGRGDQAMLALTNDPNDLGVQFRFGGIVGVRGSSVGPVVFNPTGVTYSTVAEIPLFLGGGRLGSFSAAHTAANLKLGMGDPCRLVGFTVAQIKALSSTETTLTKFDNGHWRMPTREEVRALQVVTRLTTFTGGGSGIGISADGSANFYQEIPFVQGITQIGPEDKTLPIDHATYLPYDEREWLSGENNFFGTKFYEQSESAMAGEQVVMDTPNLVGMTPIRCIRR